MTTTIHFILSADAAGYRVLDPRDPTGGSRGGGSPAGFMGLVRAMGRLTERLPKYAVTAIGPFRDKRVRVDGVDYVRLTETQGLRPPEVAFAFYDTRPLMGIPARLRIASHHTLIPHHSWIWNDVNTAPCDWARDYLKTTHAPHSVWKTLPNAVEGLDGVKYRPTPGRVIYHTSPDRGLHLLLNAWPQIRARVPHATLHVVGAPEEIIEMSDHAVLAGGYFWQRAQELKTGLDIAHKAGGVQLLGRLPREALLRELEAAACFAFPAEVSAPSETFSISLLECCDIGVPVVLTPVDALESIYANSGALLVPGPARETMPAFVDSVCSVLTDRDLARAVSDVERTFALGFSFDKSARVLDDIITEGLSKARARKEAA